MLQRKKYHPSTTYKQLCLDQNKTSTTTPHPTDIFSGKLLSHNISRPLI